MNAQHTAEAPGMLARAADGDMDAWGALLASHHRRLMAVADFRLDPRLRGRIDPADVLQDAFLTATSRRAEFFAQSAQPLFLWLRWMLGNTLLEVHRHHLGVQMRDAKRESGDGDCGSTRSALVAQLTAGATGPSTAAGRAELHDRLNEALDRMHPADREVLALRHFEQLTSTEAAQVLGIQERAAAKRYLRALERLRELLSDVPGGLTGFRP